MTALELKALGILALVVALIGGWVWQREKWTQAGIEECQAKSLVLLNQANQKAQAAASDYEALKAQRRPKVITITREVASAVQADSDCSQRAIPASLRDALTRAGHPDDTGQPDAAVPAASAANPYDLGSFGAGLRRRLAGAAGLSGAASGAR